MEQAPCVLIFLFRNWLVFLETHLCVLETSFFLEIVEFICVLGNGFVVKLIVLALRPNLGPQSCSLIPCTEK